MRLLVRAATTALLVALLGACGQVNQPPNPPALYTVTALVMQKPGDYPRACAAMPLPEPPIGCGGPAIHGLDLLTMPGVTRYWNGVRATTGFVRLVGTWDGQALTLTKSPDQVTSREAVPVPLAPCNTPTVQEPGATPPMLKQVMSDEALLKAHGIEVLEFGACGDSLAMTVVVADTDTVRFLTKRYPGVQVAGWFERVR